MAAKNKSHKKRSRKALKDIDLMRTGMPARDSIVEVAEFTKGKKTYRIIKTNEIDEYEQKPAKEHKR